MNKNKTYDSGENYIELVNHIPGKLMYAYVDTKPYVADKMFINRELKVKFVNTMEKEDNLCVIVFVRINKSDREKFINSMRELNFKLACSTNYQKCCEMLLNLEKGK